MSGYFISFEGIDGAGKSTQIKQLANYLASQGYGQIVTTQEPGGTNGAQIVREFFLDYSDQLSQSIQYLLMIGARADHIDELIAPALSQGKIVLTDRYSDSSTVYQEKITLKTYPALFGIGQKIANSCRPDLTIILDIEPALALARIEQRKDKLADSMEHNITLELLAKRRAKYLELAKMDAERCYVVNAMQESEQISETIAALVISKLRENHV